MATGVELEVSIKGVDQAQAAYDQLDKSAEKVSKTHEDLAEKIDKVFIGGAIIKGGNDIANALAEAGKAGGELGEKLQHVSESISEVSEIGGLLAAGQPIAAGIAGITYLVTEGIKAWAAYKEQEEAAGRAASDTIARNQAMAIDFSRQLLELQHQEDAVQIGRTQHMSQAEADVTEQLNLAKTQSDETQNAITTNLSKVNAALQEHVRGQITSNELDELLLGYARERSRFESDAAREAAQVTLLSEQKKFAALDTSNAKTRETAQATLSYKVAVNALAIEMKTGTSAAVASAEAYESYLKRLPAGSVLFENEKDKQQQLAQAHIAATKAIAEQALAWDQETHAMEAQAVAAAEMNAQKSADPFLSDTVAQDRGNIAALTNEITNLGLTEARRHQMHILSAREDLDVQNAQNAALRSEVQQYIDLDLQQQAASVAVKEQITEAEALAKVKKDYLVTMAQEDIAANGEEAHRLKLADLDEEATLGSTRRRAAMEQQIKAQDKQNEVALLALKYEKQGVDSTIATAIADEAYTRGLAAKATGIQKIILLEQADAMQRNIDVQKRVAEFQGQQERDKETLDGMSALEKAIGQGTGALALSGKQWSILKQTGVVAIKDLGDAAGGVFGTLEDQLGKQIDSFTLYSHAQEQLTQATRETAAERIAGAEAALQAELAAIAKKDAVRAIEETAEGIAALFVDPPAAATHLTSAAIFASIAGVSALGAYGIGQSRGNTQQEDQQLADMRKKQTSGSSGTGGGSSGSSGDGSGGLVINISAPLLTTAADLSASIGKAARMAGRLR